MEYALLAFLAVALGAGVAGGLLSAWSCHRRVLALEENCKLLFTAQEDRLNQLTRIATRQDKAAAAKERWNKDDKAVAELLKIGGGAQPPLHPWDPRTWGNSDGR